MSRIGLILFSAHIHWSDEATALRKYCREDQLKKGTVGVPVQMLRPKILSFFKSLRLNGQSIRSCDERLTDFMNLSELSLSNNELERLCFLPPLTVLRAASNRCETGDCFFFLV